jgi:hypothetical protein
MTASGGNTMLLIKDIGGVTITWRGKKYTWKKDGDAVNVPDEMAAELLAIHGGGFRERPEPVTEPAPPAEVTEPAPESAAAVTEGRPAKPAASKPASE